MRCVFCHIVLLCWVCAAIGCKSVHQTVEDSSIHTGIEFVGSLAADSVAHSETLRSTLADTTNVAAHERGVVEISRDTSGLPVRILWTRDLSLAGASVGHEFRDLHITGAVSSNHSAIVGSVDTEAIRHDNRKTEVRVPGLHEYIGVVLLGLLVAYLLYVSFEKFVLPWIKKTFLL